MDIADGQCLNAVTGMAVTAPLRSWASATVMTPLTTVRTFVAAGVAGTEADAVRSLDRLAHYLPSGHSNSAPTDRENSSMLSRVKSSQSESQLALAASRSRLAGRTAHPVTKRRKQRGSVVGG